MRLAITSVLLLTACFSASSSPADDGCAASAQAVPLCTVLADAAKYDGKEITVRGLYRMVIHGSILMAAGCPKDDYVNLRGAPNWRGDKHALAIIRSLTKKNQFQPVDIVSRGTFRVAHEGQCFGQNCLPYEFEETELLCATPAKTNASPGAADPKPGTPHVISAH
jgi:hypothetical protein